MNIHPSLFNLYKPTNNTISGHKRGRLSSSVDIEEQQQPLTRKRKPRGPTRDYVKPSYIQSKACNIVPIQETVDIEDKQLVDKDFSSSSLKLHKQQVYHSLTTSTKLHEKEFCNYEHNPGIIVEHKTVPEDVKLVQKCGKSYFDIEYHGWCWYCCHVFDWKAIGCPIHYNPHKKIMTLFGFFCSLECALAYGMKQINGFLKQRICNFIIILRKSLARANNIHLSTSECNVIAAEDIAVLKVFGGWMEINEFRQKYCNSSNQVQSHIREFIVAQDGLIRVVPAAFDYYKVDKSQYISKFSETPLLLNRESHTPMKIDNSTNNALTTPISHSSLEANMKSRTPKSGKPTHILDYKQPMHNASVEYKKQSESISNQGTGYSLLMQTLGVKRPKKKK